ncbi:OLC1v1018785C1 [Oldenlandia corymbosa var. corymbosa]|uniref:OLC1v1018785C1 n=2 Tax=Oldenlandia corymbosa var. corymbosa TaxID=529605 RepID=A0AAV1ECH8_OLDCO|nr:OLC1v1018785C1 [Oldenlandia corymbosa var. corymbosa]
MKMVLALVMGMLVVSQLALALTSPTAPAFLWSPHQDGVSNSEAEVVDYRTLQSKDLAKSVMSEGGWSSLLCSGKQTQETLDFALLFVGKELQTADISTNKKLADPSLVDLLKASVWNSKFSLAFPYVAASGEKNAIETSLVSEFENGCGNNLGINDVAVMQSCSLNGDRFQTLADVPAVRDYLAKKMEKKTTGPGNLIVICNGGSQSESDLPASEAQLLSEVIGSVERLDAKYSVLYVSDPSVSVNHHSFEHVKRFLAETNVSTNSTCDGVCQIKSSLLEGLFVAIVLLIILISGLCCMAGIDTPTRFETPQDS